MKIAIVIERYDPSAGGNERSTEQIARRLVARGHGVTVFASRAGAGLEGGPSTGLGTGRVEAMGGRLGTGSALGLWRFARWARGRLESGRFDASLSMTTAVPATLVQPRGGTVRETILRNIARRPTELRRKLKALETGLSPKRLMLLALESRTLNDHRVKKVVAISRYVADQLFHHYALSKKVVVEVPNAAEPSAMSELDRRIVRGRMRAALRLGDGDVAFLFAARNPALKGLAPLLRAMSRVAAREPRARLIVAGVLSHSWLRRVEKEGLGDVVRWIGPTGEMDALYAAADVTVLPTWYDPSSKVVLESLLRGVPAISTLYNGASQWVLSPTGREVPPSPFEAGDGALTRGDVQRAGRVIREPTDIDALAGAMVELCDDAERKRCAVATVGLERHISMDRHVERLEELLKETV